MSPYTTDATVLMSSMISERSSAMLTRNAKTVIKHNIILIIHTYIIYKSSFFVYKFHFGFRGSISEKFPFENILIVNENISDRIGLGYSPYSPSIC